MSSSCLSHNTWFFGPQDSIYCSGWNETGQLGLGSTVDQHTLTNFSLPGETVVAVGCGYQHSIFVTASGKVFGAGSNEHGQLGLQNPDKIISAPVPIPFKGRVVSVACGSEHSLFVTSEGKLFSCGSHEYGQLGIGQSSARNLFVPVPVSGFGNLKVTKVQCGFQHSFAWTDDGQIFSFGKNDMGQLCHRTTRPIVDTPTVLNLGFQVKFIAPGDNHTVVVNSSNEAFAVGFFHREFDFGHVPISLGKFNEEVIGFAGGVFHCLILTASKQLYGYGQNGYKQVGCEQGPNVKTFVQIHLPGNPSISSIACGFHHSVVITADRKAIAWGAQSRGQLGTGLRANMSLPAVISAPTGVHSVYRSNSAPAGIEEVIEVVEFSLPAPKRGGDKDAQIRELERKVAEQAAIIARQEAEITSLKSQVQYQSQAKTLQEVGALNISFTGPK